MNRPIRPLTNNPNVGRATSSNERQFHSNRRRGLCTAEEIVTLILKRYGLNEEPVENDDVKSVETHVGVPIVSAVPAQQQSFCWE